MGAAVGGKLGAAIKAQSNTSLVTAGPGEQGLVCQSAAFHIGADGKLDIVMVADPKEPENRPGLSLLDIKTKDGKSIFGMSQGDIKQFYGEPSEVRDTGMREHPNQTYVYYFSKGAKPFATLHLVFATDGPDANKLGSVSCSKANDFDTERIASQTLATFPWPRGL